MSESLAATQLDPTEQIRRQRQQELNVQLTRDQLKATYGQIWSTEELSQDFEPIGFMAPLLVVRRLKDGVKGSLEFQHNPRFYFNWQEHT